MRSLNIAATGMSAQQLNVDVISNNIANMATTGFKRARPEFQDLLYQSQRQTGSASSESGTLVPAGVDIGLGVKTAAVYRVLEQGPLVGTENDLDLAIQGRGYLTVELPTGEQAYTRSGNLQLSPEGQIVTADGYPVSPGITVPANALEVTVNAEGGVSARIPGQVEPQALGQVELASFANEVGLKPLGNNLFGETAASGPASIGTPGSEGFGTMLQGYLENSNVNPVSEITSLITAQRAYELNSRVITASDTMMGTVTQLRG
ncbi:MAG TPA: flagellar basal-body rod protein FlgG [Geminicoccus sp.]|jgi:flagellar basal-body rod protein FlgG|uniref:flagellar basal-body rod protein FlgG n=1 Tax=Geminicoccus sp. TaxID=2024832 RepID=UPI002E34614B|nr:flagellar basal-body rod protein FlgG [Geminicoccus sp.]HEX2525529.1 flagellar basal-body rod protein FlgG [Geminicoccus sp.]